MMRGRERRWGKRARRSPLQRAAVPPTQTRTLRDQLLASALVDRALGRLLTRPRALQVAGIVVGLALVALTVRPLVWPGAPYVTPANATALGSGLAPALPTAGSLTSSGERDAEVLNVVAAYNQASITAAVFGRVDTMAPYLAPDGRTWAEVQAEYQRRAARGEAHDPALTRWGVLRLAMAGDTATVETQEQWDDITSVGGQVVASRRGILTRNTYTLRRSASMDRWLITDIATTTLIN
jgi:hypothetical protein